MKAGIESSQLSIEVLNVPIADGGDGTLDAVETATASTSHSVDVIGAIGQPVKARWLAVGDQALVELACASGLAMLSLNQLDPLGAHTVGTGQVLLNCLEAGYHDVIVCVGGSASTDGGAGLLTALGAKFLDKAGHAVPLGGGSLRKVSRCDLSALEKWNHTRIRVATDVTSPLLGRYGAASIFGAQKGATLAQVSILDQALKQFADVLESATGQYVRDVAGAGAAGGTGFGVACALNAEIVSGFQWLAAIVDLENKISQSDLVITAEGRLDHQSLVGKATGELVKLCQKYHKPLWVVPAVSEENIDWHQHGIELVVNASVSGEPATFASVQELVHELVSTID